MRGLYPRKGESLRDAELRWQARVDPQIRDMVAKGKSRGKIAARLGISKVAVGSALRRQRERDMGALHRCKVLVYDRADDRARFCKRNAQIGERFCVQHGEIR